MVPNWTRTKQILYPQVTDSVKLSIQIYAKPNLTLKFFVLGDFDAFSIDYSYIIKDDHGTVVAESKKFRTLSATRREPKHTIRLKWLPSSKQSDSITVDLVFKQKEQIKSRKSIKPSRTIVNSLVNNNTQQDLQRFSHLPSPKRTFPHHDTITSTQQSNTSRPPEVKRTPVTLFNTQHELQMITKSRSVSPIGIKNQGATCYMNSLIQALYNIPLFRAYVFQLTSANDFVRALQSLFAWLQVERTPASTRELTHALGWTSEETSQQQDAQEFNRRFMDILSTKIGQDPAKEPLFALFRGKMRMFVRGSHFESATEEVFMDITLTVKGCDSVLDSFEQYVAKENVQRYDTGESIEEVTIGSEFVRLPPVLFLHLSRYEFDIEKTRMVKINTEFRYPLSLDLGDFLGKANDHQGSTKYELFGVLVHSGTASRGHYYALVRPSADHTWFKFNDSTVTEIDEERVLEDNIGGATVSQTEKTYSAYMLVYIQKSEIARLFAPLSESDIPQTAIDDIKKQKTRKDSDRLMVTTVKVATFRTLATQAVNLITSIQKHCKPLKISIKPGTTVSELKKSLSAELLLPVSRCRLWLCTDEYRLIRPLSEGRVSALPTRTFFLEKLSKKSSATDTDGTLLNIYVFCPGRANPLRFIKTAFLKKSQTLKDAADIVRAKLHVEDALTPYARASFVGYQLVSDTVAINDLPILMNGSAVVFEGISEMSQAETTEQATDHFYYRKEFPRRMPTGFLDFLKQVDTEIAFPVTRHGRPIYIHIPGSVSGDDVLAMVQHATNKPYNPEHDRLLLFVDNKAQPVCTDDIASSMIQLGHSYSLKVVPADGVDYRTIAFSVCAEIFHEDIRRVLIAPTDTVATLAQKAQRKGLIKQARIFGIRDRRITANLEMEDEVGDYDHVRFESFPEGEFSPVSEQDYFVQIVHAKLKDDGAVFEKTQPFFFKIGESETLCSFRRRFETLLRYETDLLQLLRYLAIDSTNNHRVLEDGDVISRFILKGGVLIVGHLGRRVISPYIHQH